MIRITDKSFHYTPSYNTDLRKKFKKMMQEQRASEAKARAAYTPTQDASVVALGSRSRRPPKAS
jgi:hypothetical protein